MASIHVLNELERGFTDGKNEIFKSVVVDSSVYQIILLVLLNQLGKSFIYNLNASSSIDVE